MTDFEVCEDTLDLQYSATGFTSLTYVQDVATEVTQDGVAGLFIDPGNDNSVFVQNLTVEDFATMSVTI